MWHSLFDMSRRVALAILVALIVAAGVGLFLRSNRCRDLVGIEGAGFEVEQSGEDLLVVAISETGFPVGALDWVLQIGDLGFGGGSYSDATLDELTFTIPIEARSLLADGDPIAISYRNPMGSATRGFTRLEATAARSATLRLTPHC